MYAGLRHWAEIEPDRIALLIDGETPVTYAALEARANQLARYMRHAGLHRGDHIAALVGNSTDIIALAWAAYRAGLYLTPLPTRLSAPETAYIVENATAKLVFATPGHAAQLGAITATLATLDDAFETELNRLPPTPLPDESPGALMMYSSGTTGAPKGIFRPLPAPDTPPDVLPAFARDLIPLFNLGAGTRYLSTQPLYHAAALRFVLAISAVGGMSVIQPKFDAARALELIDTYRLTLSQWVPTMFRRLLALPETTRAGFSGASQLRALHGAAPCTPTLKRRMFDWWGPILTEYYSGSEGVGLTLIDGPEWLAHPGSVGQTVKGELQILGLDDTPSPVGETGRVFFSGTPTFAYFNDPAKTVTKTSRQGWQTFGDIGHVDAEGYLFLSDRADDMIISGGVNLYPQEIEAAIETAPGVAMCGVVGVPDSEFDERPVAFIVPSADVPSDFIGQVRDHLAEALGRLKQPRDIYVVEHLPMSDTGKLQRRKLRDMAGD